MTANFDENSSSGECQSDSMIQGLSREVKERRGETNRDGRSEGVKSREDIE